MGSTPFLLYPLFTGNPPWGYRYGLQERGQINRFKSRHHRSLSCLFIWLTHASGLFEPSPECTTSIILDCCCACLITSSLRHIVTWHPVVRCSVTTGPSDTSGPFCSNGPRWVWPYFRIRELLTTALQSFQKLPTECLSRWIPPATLYLQDNIIQSVSIACFMVWTCCTALSGSGHYSQLAAFEVTQ